MFRPVPAASRTDPARSPLRPAGRISLRGLLVLLAAASSGIPANDARADPQPSCTLAGLDNPPPPAIGGPLVSRTETIDVERTLDVAVSAMQSMDLEDTISSSDSLPHVTGTEPLTPGEFGAPGSRRLVCLSDGSTVLEEVLLREQDANGYRFRYIVWNYTSPAASAVDYGVGYFEFTPLGSDRTSIRWTYSFSLKRDRLPGRLGGPGRFLFRIAFLDRAYARMMKGTLAAMKAEVERFPRQSASPGATSAANLPAR